LTREGALPAGWSDDTTNALIDATIRSLPLTLILVSFMMAVMTQWLSRMGLRASGVDVPAFRRAHEWMLPRSFVFIYLIVVVLDLLIAAGDESYMSVVVVNLLPLLRFAFTIQAIGFFFFLAHHKRWNRIVPL